MLTKHKIFALPKFLTAIIILKWGLKNLDSHYFFKMAVSRTLTAIIFFQMAVSRTLTAIIFFKWQFQEPWQPLFFSNGSFKNLDNRYFFQMAVSRTLTAIIIFQMARWTAVQAPRIVISSHFIGKNPISILPLLPFLTQHYHFYLSCYRYYFQ